MAKSGHPGKRDEMREIARKYAELKSLRSVKRQEYLQLLEADMETARAEFGIYLQSKIDRDGFPYVFTVSDLMKAMGTTDRGTVNRFIGGARARSKSRYLDEALGEFPSLSIIEAVAVDGVAYVGVLDSSDGSTRRLSWRFTDGGAAVCKWSDYLYEDDTRQPVRALSAPVPRSVPLGSDKSLKGDVPHWIEWVTSREEWLRIADGWPDA